MICVASTYNRKYVKKNLDGRQIRLQLRLFNEKNLLLLARGFHWVQEYPFNR